MSRPKGYSAAIVKDRQLYGNDAKKYGWMDGATKYRVSLKNSAGKTVTFNYFTGSAITDRPTFEDVMGAAISDALSYDSAPTLEEFASEFGYDLEDDRKQVEKTFKACESMSERVHALLGDDFDDMAEYTRDR